MNKLSRLKSKNDSYFEKANKDCYDTIILFVISNNQNLFQLSSPFSFPYLIFVDHFLASHDAMQPINEVITTESEKTNQGNKCLLKLISAPELLHSVTVTGVSGCYHISCVTPDRVWISYKTKLVLTNTTGDTLGKRNDLCRGYGVHAVNNESELIYIDKYHNVNKLSNDLTTTIKFINKPDSAWIPRCVYWSYLTVDIVYTKSPDTTKADNWYKQYNTTTLDLNSITNLTI